MNFSNITRTSITVSFANPNNNEMLVLAKERYQIDTISDFPTEITANNSYPNAMEISGAKVLFKGLETSFTAIDLTKYKLYYFAIYELIDGVYTLIDSRSRWTLR